MRARVTIGALLLALRTAPPLCAQPAIVLENPGPATFSAVGISVAALGSDVLLGADGAALRYDGNTWALVRTFVPPVTGPAGTRGGSHLVAAVGGNVLLGVPWDNAAGAEAGSAFLFDGMTGALLLTLTEPVPGASHRFGHAVAALGNDLLVAAPFADVGGASAGAVYLFDGTTGSLLRTFLDPTPADDDRFGMDLAVAGGNVAISAPWDGAAGYSPIYRDGAVRVFDGATGTLLYTLTDPGPNNIFDRDGFGNALAALGSDVLVGRTPAYCCDYPERAYRFDGPTGGLVQTFTRPETTSEGFGRGIAAVGANVLVASTFTSDPADDLAATLFDGATGAVLRRFPHPHGGENQSYEVAAVGGVGSNALVGAPSANLGGGIAYLFCGGAVGCGPCETCAASGPCTVGPAPTCRAPAARRLSGSRMQLKIRRAAQPDDDQVSWKGAASGAGLASVPVDQYGRLRDYTLCLFDESGGTPVVAFRAAASPCTPPGCRLRGSRHMVRYRDRDRLPDGLSQLLMRSRGDETQIRVLGSGPNLTGRPFGLPTLPLALPVTLQLEDRDGRCWSGRYSAGGVFTNSATLFDGRPD